MRQRTTIFNPTDSNDGIIESVNDKQLQLSSIKYPCEDKFTLKAPKLKYIDKLRIQINQIESQKVLYSKYQPGLNIYCKPKVKDGRFSQKDISNELHGFIDQLFDVPTDSWIISMDSLFYHIPETNPSPLMEYIKSLVNNAHNVNLKKPFNVEYIYDNEVITIKLTGQISPHTLISKKTDVNKEIGIFLAEKNISSGDDLVLSGLRVILNNGDVEDEYLQKTLFHVKPRQRRSQGTYKSIIEKNGMHPFLNTTLVSDTPDDEDLLRCKLYYYLNLNRAVFLDKYQVPKSFQTFINFGNSDLELPEYKINEWGNEVLMEVKDVNDIRLPLHSRYQLPNNSSTKNTIEIEDPLLFYGCDVKDSHLLGGSPFDSKLDFGGNYERFFTDDTVFYHIKSETNKLLVEIPHGSGDINIINLITNLAFACGVALIIYKLSKLFTRRSKVSTAKKEQ